MIFVVFGKCGHVADTKNCFSKSFILLEKTLKSDKELLTKELQQLKQDIQTIQKEHNSIVDKLKKELKKIYDVFPKIKELLRIENLCRHIGFSEELIKIILEMKPVGFKGKLYSPEYRRDFKTDHSISEIKEHSTDKDKLNLLLIESVKLIGSGRSIRKAFQNLI